MKFFNDLLLRNSFHSFRYIDFRRFIFSKFMITIAQQVQFGQLSPADAAKQFMTQAASELG